MKLCNTNIQILITFSLTLIPCFRFGISNAIIQELHPKYLAHVIYDGNCTIDDVDPEILTKCAMYTCWKSPTTGVKIMQKTGCDEKAFCDDVNRSIVSEPDKEWPNCCPPPKCTSSEETLRPEHPGQLANILYSGSCTREDIDPEMFNECAMYTCWKCPKTGIKIIKKSGCDEEAICNDSNRRSLFNRNKQWPSCCSRSKCPSNGGPVELDELANVIYAGGCTRADVNPEIFTECALHTCWKNPDNGYIAMQRFGCNEDVPCHGLHRNHIIRWDRVWPNCCPSPICLEESV